MDNTFELAAEQSQGVQVGIEIEARRLYSLGIGPTDAHLIASVFISGSTLLWTRDRRLRKAAEALDIHVNLA